MNGAQGHMASDPCERVLDYAYGELEGDALDQFKLHLLTCEKCKAELAGLERVRAAVKQAMPMVDPPADRMNALTAQLLHAAAQNKPKEGKLLMFARKTRVIVSHPAYAAAAALILVGGAVGLQWSLGRLTMPVEKAPAASEIAVAAPAPVAAAPEVAAEPGAHTFELKSKDKEPAPVELSKVLEKRDENQVVLDGAGKQWAVKPAPKPAAKKSAARSDDMKLLSPKSGGGEFDALQGAGGVGLEGRSAATSSQGPASSGAKRSAARPAKEEAPADARKNQNMVDPFTDDGARELPVAAAKREPPRQQAPARNYQPPPPPVAAAPAAPQPVATPQTIAAPGYNRGARTNAENAPAGSVALQQNYESLAAQQRTSSNVASQQKSTGPDATTLHKQLDEYASSGRCEEVVRSFQELEKRFPSSVTVNDRGVYVRCLRATGRNEEAMANEFRLEQERRPVSTRSKKAKQAAPPSKAKPAGHDAVMSPSF